MNTSDDVTGPGESEGLPAPPGRRRRRARARALFVLGPLAAALVAVGCSTPAPPAQQLRELRSLDGFARDFDAAAGAPRLLLLLSPT